MKDQFFKNKNLMVFISIFLLRMFVVYPSVYQDTIPLDPEIRHGRLANGLTYYIKPVEDGPAEMEIRLLVKAGKTHEDQDQYEFEHLLEHVVLKAGKHMTLGKAYDLGFGFGQINGNTSWDFTQYLFLSIKNKKEREIAFQMFQDIIWDLDFKDEYIDSERSIIINETANRGGFDSHSLMIGLESFMLGRGADRPEDFVDHINTFPYEALKRYYKDWYRPDLMAIVVVGDIDNVDIMENEIKEKFSRAKPIKDLRSPIKNYREYRNSPPQFINKEHPYSTKDSKDDTVNMFLYIRQKGDREEYGLEALRSEQKRWLFIRMLKDRLDEQYHQRYATAFHVLPEFLWQPSLGLRLHIRIEDGSEREVILKSMRLLKQLRRDGFSEQEFIKGKTEYLESLVKQDTTKISFWMDNIREHFVYGEVLPSAKQLLLKDMVKDLTLAEVNQFVRSSIKTQLEKVDIIMLARPGHRALSYTEKEVREWIAEADGFSVEPYSQPIIPTELISSDILQKLKRSTFQEKPVEIPGAAEYLLGNGVRVVLKPMPIEKDRYRHKLRFRGFSRKGIIGCYSKSDYYSALNAPKIVYHSGIGGLDKFDLKRYFADKDFNGQVIPYIDYGEAGIRGSLSLSELETALQLVYLYFSAPNKDSLAFKDWRLNATSSLAKKRMHDNVFKSSIEEIIGDYTVYPKSYSTLKGVSKTDMDRAYEIYRDVYGNAEDFTFIFTGDFPEDKVLSLCQKYLGNLPVSEEGEECEVSKLQLKNSLPKPRSITIPYREYLQQVKVELAYISKMDTNVTNWKEEAKLKLLQALLNFSLKEEMRFRSDKGGLYSINSWSNTKKSRLYNEVFIGFSSSREDVDRLIGQAKKIVESFRSTPVNEALLERFIKKRVNYLEKNIKRSIPEKIYNYYKYGEAWKSVKQEQEYLESLTPEDIQIMAYQALNGKPFEFKMASTSAVQ